MSIVDDSTTARRTLSAVNPRTGEVDYQFVPPTSDEIHKLARELRTAQPGWRGLGLDRRMAAMRRWADEIDASAEDIGRAEAIDTGRRRVAHEVPKLVSDSIRGWCNQAPEIVERGLLSGVSSTSPTVTYRMQFDPYPLVGVISPWNHPFLLSTLDAIPALLAGCSVIIKPSEIAPRFIEPVAASIAAVPELHAVLRYVAGAAEVGRAVVENIDALCFTGSVATGRRLAQICAERFIPAFLELGGNDPVIVAASVDIPRAAAAVLKGAVQNTGQLCFSTERVYVDERIHDEFVDVLVSQAEKLELNYPDIGHGHLGPFISSGQAAIVDAQLADAVQRGAKVRTGGPSEVHGGGRYMRATVLTDVDHSMAVMRDETFGPVVPIMAYRDIDQALELANDTDFGLSGAVLAGTGEEAAQIAYRLEAGAISLQDTSLNVNIMRDAEKMSFGLSGLGGSRMGPAALIRFMRKKALVERQGPVLDMTALSEDGFAG
jgi:succinate-semialdehyde dehydrogenase / glutarate-semialdehyde dehydrogenase